MGPCSQSYVVQGLIEFSLYYNWKKKRFSEALPCVNIYPIEIFFCNFIFYKWVFLLKCNECTIKYTDYNSSTWKVSVSPFRSSSFLLLLTGISLCVYTKIFYSISVDEHFLPLFGYYEYRHYKHYVFLCIYSHVCLE